mmetsp:Transcript_58160/g.87658  ORF Transcript_58160/g.87658 Transcript_58160/m.87658 type:complete len:258 (-) Transcript_58160:124-897(-)
MMRCTSHCRMHLLCYSRWRMSGLALSLPLYIQCLRTAPALLPRNAPQDGHCSTPCMHSSLSPRTECSRPEETPPRSPPLGPPSSPHPTCGLTQPMHSSSPECNALPQFPRTADRPMPGLHCNRCTTTRSSSCHKRFVRRMPCLIPSCSRLQSLRSSPQSCTLRPKTSPPRESTRALTPSRHSKSRTGHDDQRYSVCSKHLNAPPQSPTPSPTSRLPSPAAAIPHPRSSRSKHIAPALPPRSEVQPSPPPDCTYHTQT